MPPTSAASPSVVRLARALTEGDAGDALADELTGWLASSTRFRGFATTYRDKIHKKVRFASDAEALRDVRAELLAAHRLLVDQRFTIAYEAYGAGKTGPDLTVSYRSSLAFNLEVTRLRKPPEPAALGATLLAKLRRLPPSAANLILLASDRPALATDIAVAVHALRARADGKDDAFFERRGLDSARGFYERFLRLGGVIGWCDQAIDPERAELWSNRSARTALPDRAARAALACLQERAARP